MFLYFMSFSHTSPLVVHVDSALLNKHNLSQHNQNLKTLSHKVEGMSNGVEALKVEDGEQEEVKQPRVTKAQKRRVRGSDVVTLSYEITSV